jgi:hypothetical protein
MRLAARGDGAAADVVNAEVERLRRIEEAARAVAGTDEVCTDRLLVRLEELRDVLATTAPPVKP